jgi:hypothetical protein
VLRVREKLPRDVRELEESIFFDVLEINVHGDSRRIHVKQHVEKKIKCGFQSRYPNLRRLSEDIIDGHSTCKYGACTIGIISSGAASGSVFKYDACTIGIVSSGFASGSAFNYDACTIGIFPSGFASGSAFDYKYEIIQCF